MRAIDGGERTRAQHFVEAHRKKHRLESRAVGGPHGVSEAGVETVGRRSAVRTSVRVRVFEIVDASLRQPAVRRVEPRTRDLSQGANDVLQAEPVARLRGSGAAPGAEQLAQALEDEDETRRETARRRGRLVDEAGEEVEGKSSPLRVAEAGRLPGRIGGVRLLGGGEDEKDPLQETLRLPPDQPAKPLQVALEEPRAGWEIRDLGDRERLLLQQAHEMGRVEEEPFRAVEDEVEETVEAIEGRLHRAPRQRRSGFAVAQPSRPPEQVAPGLLDGGADLLRKPGAARGSAAVREAPLQLLVEEPQEQAPETAVEVAAQEPAVGRAGVREVGVRDLGGARARCEGARARPDPGSALALRPRGDEEVDALGELVGPREEVGDAPPLPFPELVEAVDAEEQALLVAADPPGDREELLQEPRRRAGGILRAEIERREGAAARGDVEDLGRRKPLVEEGAELRREADVLTLHVEAGHDEVALQRRLALRARGAREPGREDGLPRVRRGPQPEETPVVRLDEAGDPLPQVVRREVVRLHVRPLEELPRTPAQMLLAEEPLGRRRAGGRLAELAQLAAQMRVPDDGERESVSLAVVEVADAAERLPVPGVEEEDLLPVADGAAAEAEPGSEVEASVAADEAERHVEIDVRQGEKRLVTCAEAPVSEQRPPGAVGGNEARVGPGHDCRRLAETQIQIPGEPREIAAVGGEVEAERAVAELLVAPLDELEQEIGQRSPLPARVAEEGRRLGDEEGRRGRRSPHPGREDVGREREPGAEGRRATEERRAHSRREHLVARVRRHVAREDHGGELHEHFGHVLQLPDGSDDVARFHQLAQAMNLVRDRARPSLEDLLHPGMFGPDRGLHRAVGDPIGRRDRRRRRRSRGARWFGGARGASRATRRDGPRGTRGRPPPARPSRSRRWRPSAPASTARAGGRAARRRSRGGSPGGAGARRREQSPSRARVACGCRSGMRARRAPRPGSPRQR